VIKTILVAVSGGEGDRSVLETALALAQPLEAHLDVYHLRVTPDESAALTPHVDFAQGRALTEAMNQLERDAETKSAGSACLFREFCERNGIRIIDQGPATGGVSASFLEEKDEGVQRLIFQARHRDLVVVGRPHAHGTRRSVAGHLLMASGRPVVIAPSVVKPASEGGVIMVGWKETPEAARAIGAAMPILKNARRVVLAVVADADPAPTAGAAENMARQLNWHGIHAEINVIKAGRSVAELLHDAAEAAHADLLVIGAYGHSRVRELIYGGVTEALLDGASLPIFLAH
jgi:nucleotide-binding universal stress UspA family protein